ncbi:MAG: LPS assembly lipoprotein LptE [Sumerlaeia bacterium]
MTMVFLRFLATLLICLTLSACATVSRERTLPPSVRSVYIPMFVNRSAEIGIEEDATVLTQKEFLADGRLDLATKRNSDAYVIVTIKEFDTDGISFDTDEYPRRLRQTIRAEVQVLKNKPGRAPYGPSREVTASRTYNSDKRSISYTPEPWATEILLQEFARQIVLEVITGRLDEP